MDHVLTQFGKACRDYRRAAGVFMAHQAAATGRSVSEISAIERGKNYFPSDYISEFVAWLQLDEAAASRLERLANERDVFKPTEDLSLHKPAPRGSIDRLSDLAIRAKVALAQRTLALAHPVTSVSLVSACEHGGLDQFKDYELHVEPDSEMGDVEAYVSTSPLRMVVAERTYLGAFQNVARYRFTLAHELGHIACHLPLLNAPDAFAARTTRELSYQSTLEHQANRFAAELLMPESIVRTVADPKALSTLCGVSEVAADIRMRDLRMWPKPNSIIVKGFDQLLAQLRSNEGTNTPGKAKISVRQESWGKLLYDFGKDEFSAQVFDGHQPVPKAPIGIGWVILGACNEKCGICYGNAEQLPSSRLKLKDALTIARVLKEAEIMRVVISGGEPLMYPNIFDIVDSLAESGISVVLGTNGTFLSSMNAHRAKKCTRVEISLDAADQALNNTLRPSRLPQGDSWKESIAAIECCLATDIPIRVLTTITSLNQHQLVELAELLHQTGVSDWALSWVIPAGRAKSAYDQLRPDDGVIQQQLKQIRTYYPGIQIRYSNRNPKSYDRFYFLILPDGQIATEDMSLGKKVTFGSALTVPALSTWTNKNFDIGLHFDKWVAGRVRPLAL